MSSDIRLIPLGFNEQGDLVFQIEQDDEPRTLADAEREIERLKALLRELPRMLDEAADQIDGQLPDASGGRFAKKFAANALRGQAALMERRIERETRSRDQA